MCLPICASLAPSALSAGPLHVCTTKRREVLDSQFRPSKFPKAFAYALLYVTSTLTLPNAIFVFVAYPEEATRNGESVPPLMPARCTRTG